MNEYKHLLLVFNLCVSWILHALYLGPALRAHVRAHTHAQCSLFQLSLLFLLKPFPKVLFTMRYSMMEGHRLWQNPSLTWWVVLGKLFHFFLPCVLIHYQGLFPKDLLREAALYWYIIECLIASLASLPSKYNWHLLQNYSNQNVSRYLQMFSEGETPSD